MLGTTARLPGPGRRLELGGRAGTVVADQGEEAAQGSSARDFGRQDLPVVIPVAWVFSLVKFSCSG